MYKAQRFMRVGHRNKDSLQSDNYSLTKNESEQGGRETRNDYGNMGISLRERMESRQRLMEYKLQCDRPMPSFLCETSNRPSSFIYKDDEEKQRLAEMIRSETVLKRRTRVRSNYELMFKKEILKGGLYAIYEPFTIPVLSSQYYTPDFVFPRYQINGKAVVMEPHGGMLMSGEYMKKLKDMKDNYPVHIILVSTPSFARTGISLGTINGSVDEFWCIDHNSTGRRFLKGKLAGMMNRVRITYGDAQNDIISYTIAKLRIRPVGGMPASLVEAGMA
ncbi:MAG: hypothetical protein KGI06_05180 [Candidatus Micrarchaeota archaeon]|nr:hypothetical protein [Candidatus Micrarchaeota archaeon]